MFGVLDGPAPGIEVRFCIAGTCVLESPRRQALSGTTGATGTFDQTPCCSSTSIGWLAYYLRGLNIHMPFHATDAPTRDTRPSCISSAALQHAQ